MITFGSKKPKNIYSYLAPTFEDLLALQEHGMKIKTQDGQNIFCKAFVLAIIGDFPTMSEMIAHKTHASEFGCRICKIQGTRRLVKRGYSFIADSASIKIRKKADFDVNEVSTQKCNL